MTAPPSPTPPPPSRTAVESDARRDRPLAIAERVAEERDRAAPSPDQGEHAGRTTDGAWRRDWSTMHAELSDGATSSQPARLRHGGRRPIVTAGGAARAGGRHWRRDPQRDAGQPAERAAVATPDESPSGDSARTAAGERVEPQVVATVEFPRSAESPSQDQAKVRSTRSGARAASIAPLPARRPTTAASARPRTSCTRGSPTSRAQACARTIEPCRGAAPATHRARSTGPAAAPLRPSLVYLTSSRSGPTSQDRPRIVITICTFARSRDGSTAYGSSPSGWPCGWSRARPWSASWSTSTGASAAVSRS